MLLGNIKKQTQGIYSFLIISANQESKFLISCKTIRLFSNTVTRK